MLGKCANGVASSKHIRKHLPRSYICQGQQLPKVSSCSSFSSNRNSPFRACSVAAAGRQQQQRSAHHFSSLNTSRTPSPSQWRSSGPAPRSVIARASEDQLLPLGLDFLTFLGATVLVIPVFKSLKISPVLGFLFSGLVLQQLG